MKSMLKSLISVAAAALALTSCSNDAAEEVINKGEFKTLEVNASIDLTRTVMAADHLNLMWSDNDEIYLYIGETAVIADVKKIKPKTGGKITGVTYQEGDNVYANYSLGNSFSKGVKEAEIKIDAKQTQSEANVFAGENLPMTARGTIKDGSVDLKFQPFGCVLVFNVYGSAYNTNEKIKSIKFETSVGCCGYQLCDLTLEKLNYAAYESSTSVTVTLTTPATIGAAKPNDTKIGENQVYMVVAPVNYGDATITVNTTIDSENIYNTYTFKTANGIDCSTNTARVVNLNLAKAVVEPVIEVPTVGQQSSDGSDLPINDIVFKNFTASELGNAEAGVYSDAELTQPLTDSWLMINSSVELVSGGKLICQVAANESTESRTAYIGIKCASVQAAIAVTQVAKGASTDKYFVKVTEAPADWTGEYLIVYEGADGANALDGSLSKIDVVNDYISVTITEQGILSNEITNASLVKILKIDGGGYILQAPVYGQYIYSSSDSNQLKETTTYNTAAKHPNSISIDSGSARIESHGSVLRFNSASKQMRFRYYQSTTYDRQQPVQLYKLQK